MVDVFEAYALEEPFLLCFSAFLAVLLIQNMIKMTIQTRQEEIAIMRNVGACNWYIRTPFIIEGMYIGILGSIVPILVISIGYALCVCGTGRCFSVVYVYYAADMAVYSVGLSACLSGRHHRRHDRQFYRGRKVFEVETMRMRKAGALILAAALCVSIFPGIDTGLCI